METKRISDIKLSLTGCSGIGKTTLAKAISEIYELPFISGSYSDLVPETRNVPHSDMIQQEATKVFEQDVMVLNKRNKLFSQSTRFVSDRSYLDSAAYMIDKLAHRIPECEIEDFIEKCKQLTLIHCPKVIYLPFTMQYVKNWKMEDNGKRILNKFYQSKITSIMDWIIDQYWDMGMVDMLPSPKGKNIMGNPVLYLKGEKNMTHSLVLVLNEMDHEDRLTVVDQFLAL